MKLKSRFNKCCVLKKILRFSGGLLLAHLWLRGAYPEGVAAASHPNVIFIKTDDQRADYLGCMGHPLIRTPNIDHLAENGILFENAFVTSPACAPSRACIFTGLWERKHGFNFNSNSSLAPEFFENSWPMVVKQAGYFTGYIGKNHVRVGKSGGIKQAFDYWYGNNGHSFFYPKEKYYIYQNAESDTQIEIFEEGMLNFLEPNQRFIKKAIQFLKERPKDKPFCLSINFNVPHGAGTGSMRLLPSDPELYRNTYRDVIGKFPLPTTYISAKNIKAPKIPIEVWNGKFIKQYKYVKQRDTLRERIVRTCQTITGVDNVVGHLLAELKKLGLEDNTIIIFSSDHGLMHGEFGIGGKCLLYDPCIKVPLIIYDPRLPEDKRGEKICDFALSVDIAPTILSLCGVGIPPTMQGRSLLPLIMGNKPQWRSDFFCENLFTGQNYPRSEAVRSHRWKYIRYFKRGSPLEEYEITLDASIKGEKPNYEELYDLKKDPGEKVNLAPNTRHQNILNKLRKRCNELVIQARNGPDGSLSSINYIVNNPPITANSPQP